MIPTPLPFTCLHEAYDRGQEDGHGNIREGWLESVTVPCIWWSVSSAEPAAPPTGSERVVVDLSLVVNSALVVDHRDRFTIQGRRYEVTGVPAEWDHGPFGFSPNRQVISLRAVL